MIWIVFLGYTPSEHVPKIVNRIALACRNRESVLVLDEALVNIDWVKVKQLPDGKWRVPLPPHWDESMSAILMGASETGVMPTTSPFIQKSWLPATNLLDMKSSLAKARKQLSGKSSGVVFIDVDASHVNPDATEKYVEIISESIKRHLERQSGDDIAAVAVTGEKVTVTKPKHGIYQEVFTPTNYIGVAANPHSPDAAKCESMLRRLLVGRPTDDLRLIRRKK